MLAAGDAGKMQLWRFDVAAGIMHQITTSPDRVVRYQCHKGGVVFMTVHSLVKPSHGLPYPESLVTVENFRQLAEIAPTELTLFGGTQDKIFPLATLRDHFAEVIGSLKISPYGNAVVVKIPVAEPESGTITLRATLFNLETGRSEALLDLQKTNDWVGHDGKLAGEGSAAPGSNLVVEQREGVNLAPNVIAKAPGVEISLLPIDPVLTRVTPIQASTVQWKEPDGRLVSGLLVLPRDSKGAPPPLVIQCYLYLPELFRPDGAFPSGFAAQSLAAQGIAVLQLDIPAVDRTELQESMRENEAFAHRLCCAVESLAADGRIDSKRVGIMGFSRGGYMTYWYATHPTKQFMPTVAVALDSWLGGYFDYLLTASTTPEGSDVISRINRQFGGNFWDQKHQWFNQATDIGIDGLRCPVLLTCNSVNLNISYAGALASLKLSGKPFEIHQFLGQHQLARPQERLAAMDLVVDWMKFWLKGQPPSNPDRAARWAILRKQQDEVLKTPPPPKGHWTFVPDKEQPDSRSPETKPEEKKPEPISSKN